VVYSTSQCLIRSGRVVRTVERRSSGTRGARSARGRNAGAIEPPRWSTQDWRQPRRLTGAAPREGSEPRHRRSRAGPRSSRPASARDAVRRRDPGGGGQDPRRGQSRPRTRAGPGTSRFACFLRSGLDERKPDSTCRSTSGGSPAVAARGLMASMASVEVACVMVHRGSGVTATTPSRRDSR